MRKRDRKKPSSNPFGLKYRPPRKDQSGAVIDPLPIVSTEPEIRAAEKPLRELIRAVKEGRATHKMASDVSTDAGMAILAIHAPFVTGKKIHRAVRKGHEGKHGTQEEKKARWGEYQRLVSEKLENNKRLSYSRACKAVADEKGCNAKTVWRHTNDPRKK